MYADHPFIFFIRDHPRNPRLRLCSFTSSLKLQIFLPPGIDRPRNAESAVADWEREDQRNDETNSSWRGGRAIWRFLGVHHGG